MPAKAKAKAGCNSAALSKMLGLLKHNAENSKKGEKKDDATEALNIYKNRADPDSRVKFLQEFEANGGGKTPGSLKFALNCRMSVANTKITDVSCVEYFITRLLHKLVPML